MTQLSTTVRRARKAVHILVPFGRPYHRHLLEGALATFFLVAARLAFPWPLRGLLEIVFHPQTPGRQGAVLAVVPHIGDPVVWLVSSFAVIVLIWGVSESLQRLTFTRYSVGLVRDLRSAALRQIPAAARRGQGAGDLIATVTSDAARVKTGTKSILIGMSRNGGFFLGVAVIVSLIDPLIGAVFLLGGIVTAVVGGYGGWRSSMIIRRSRVREGKLTEKLHQFLSGTSELPNSTRTTGAADSKATRVEGLTTLAVHIVLGASTCAILILAVQAGRNGSLSAGSVFTILAYVLLMHNKTVSLGRAVVRLGRVLPSAERISALAAPRRRPRPLPRHIVPSLNGHRPPPHPNHGPRHSVPRRAPS